MSDTQRDGLAELVRDNHRLEPVSGYEMADAILAAGYRKPHTITTAEELDALPVGSVIVDPDGDAWQRYTKGWTCTDRAMNTVDQPSANLTNIRNPATVLWEPSV